MVLDGFENHEVGVQKGEFAAATQKDNSMRISLKNSSVLIIASVIHQDIIVI